MPNSDSSASPLPFQPADSSSSSSVSDSVIDSIYDSSSMIVGSIPRIITDAEQFIWFSKPSIGWVWMHFGEIDIPSVSYMTDPLYDSMNMMAGAFASGSGSISIDHEGDITEISVKAVNDVLSGDCFRISIETGCGERELSNIVSVDAMLVSIYGLVTSLSDNLDEWADWNVSDRDEAISDYLDVARHMIDSAYGLLAAREDSGEYDGESGNARYAYVLNAIDTTSDLLNLISLQSKTCRSELGSSEVKANE